jgi:hypothetical protein
MATDADARRFLTLLSTALDADDWGDIPREDIDDAAGAEDGLRSADGESLLQATRSALTAFQAEQPKKRRPLRLKGVRRAYHA